MKRNKFSPSDIPELYRLGKFSSGKAAEYLDMERFEFIKYASRLGIPFIDMDMEELLTDFHRAHRMVTKESPK
jgi:predicted HTH domain antitoxin